MKFGQRLKCLRDKNKITQDELAKHLGVGRPTIAGYETKGKQPSFEILEKMADFFSVSTDYLLGRTDIKQPIQNTKNDKPSSDEISKEIRNLSPESQEELKKLIELYKLRDLKERNSELSDELTSSE